MSDPASVQLRRLLAFLPQIADGQPHAIGDVAARAGVEVASIVDDLFALSARPEDPPGWIDTISVFIEAEKVSMVAAHFRRPMRLTMSELRALALGLAVLRAEAEPGQRVAIERLSERLRLLGSTPDAGEGADRAASIGTERQLVHVPRLRDAIGRRRRVTLLYHKGSGDRAEPRTVCPFTFVVEKGTWYLVALCDRRDDIRIFRMDRIREVRLLDDTFEPVTGVDLDALVEQGTAFVGDAVETLRVRYSPRVARWIAERERGGAWTDGWLEVGYPLADREWALRHVLQYGPDAVVISPADVRQALVTRLEGMTIPG